MKKIKLFLSAAVAIFFMVFAVASLEPVDNPGTDNQPGDEEDYSALLEQFGKTYFLIDGSQVSYKKGAIPSGEGSGEIGDIVVNGKALAGGMNIITVTTEHHYTKFYITVKGVNGYLVYVPSADSVTQDPVTGKYIYSIPLIFGADFNINITVIITAERDNGDVTEPAEKEIEYVSSLHGDLEVNLFFSNEKDIDLYLIMPDGNTIFFGNRGGSYTLEDGTVVSYGLDHDSNAGCRIDGLNNENIVIPQEMVQNGVYEVKVDMYANCNSSIATDWSVVARYHGDIVENELGGNPVYGTYPVGAGNRDMTTVMKFTINNASRSGFAPIFDNAVFKPFEVNDDELAKILDYEASLLD